jgi:hypothetical protein
MIKPNIEYRDAPFELRLVKRDGELFMDAWPRRFREKDVDIVVEALQRKDWDTIIKLSIPPYIET